MRSRNFWISIHGFGNVLDCYVTPSEFPYFAPIFFVLSNYSYYSTFFVLFFFSWSWKEGLGAMSLLSNIRSVSMGEKLGWFICLKTLSFQLGILVCCNLAKSFIFLLIFIFKFFFFPIFAHKLQEMGRNPCIKIQVVTSSSSRHWSRYCKLLNVSKHKVKFLLGVIDSLF